MCDIFGTKLLHLLENKGQINLCGSLAQIKHSISSQSISAPNGKLRVFLPFDLKRATFLPFFPSVLRSALDIGIAIRDIGLCYPCLPLLADRLVFILSQPLPAS